MCEICNCCGQRQRKKKKVEEPAPTPPALTFVQYVASSRRPITGQPDKMGIEVALGNNTYGVPAGAKAGDKIRFSQNGADINVEEVKVVHLNNALVVNMPYEMYSSVTTIWYASV